MVEITSLAPSEKSLAGISTGGGALPVAGGTAAEGAGGVNAASGIFTAGLARSSTLLSPRLPIGCGGEVRR
jgi:hypothetical protein